ncbi:hypothetical protein BDZ97DRAFT_1922069 [Flammula alnicola]|nr:hypothetical protein BDZ97DRAFT_1922069 [Flammula alnicola]
MERADGSKSNTLKLRPRAPSATAYVSTASASGSASASSPQPNLTPQPSRKPNGHRSRNFSHKLTQYTPSHTPLSSNSYPKQRMRMVSPSRRNRDSYDEHCRTYKDETDEFSRTNTPVYHGSRARPTGQSHPYELSKSRLLLHLHVPCLPNPSSPPIYSWLTTGNSSSSHVSQLLRFPTLRSRRAYFWMDYGR